jgi:hypothetical protein
MSAGYNFVRLIDQACNNGSAGVQFISNGITNRILNITTANNGSFSINTSTGSGIIDHASMSEATRVGGLNSYYNTRQFINNIGGYSNIWTDNGNIVSQEATAGGTGHEWKLSPTNVIRNIEYPLDLVIARVAVEANKAVSVSCYIKKSHATDIGAKLFVMGRQLSGVDSDVVTTAPTDTTRNSVALANFTPTESGVIEIKVLAYWTANTADESVIVDDITISQAA